MKKTKFLLILLGIFMSISCSSGEYTFQSDDTLCVSSEVIEAKKVSGTDKYYRLLVRLENMPAEVAISYVSDPSVSRSLLLAIEDAATAEFSADYYSDVFQRAIKANSLPYDKKIGLYRLDRSSDSALKSYDYLRADPRHINLTAQPENLQDWYFGLCVEGIGERPDSCEVVYPVGNFVLKFSIVEGGLSEWKAVLQHVNEAVNAWSCKEK